MAQLAEVKVKIDGVEIMQFSDLMISQTMYSHHQFKIVCPAEVFGPGVGHPLQTSQNLVGAKATIVMQQFGGLGSTLEFMGLVTNIQAVKYSGHSGDIIISGFSPTILLDHGQHCKSWREKTVSEITKEVMAVFESNLLKYVGKSNHSATLPYTVQYQETAWQFMNRMAAMYGQWFFYNGKEVLFGDHKEEATSLVFGSTLSEFGLSVQVAPVNFSRVSYDYENNKTYKESPKGIEDLAGLNDLGKLAYQKSNEVFVGSPKAYTSQYVNNSEQLKQTVNISAAEAASGLVRFKGNSNSFTVQLGNIVDIDSNSGSYKIIEVEYKCDGQGNYYNEFVAIPATIKVPPISGYASPTAEAQPAVVTANHDKEGLGRVQVRFKWMKDSEHTPWIRLVGPHAGGGKGMFFVPELEEEAMVDFENGDPTKPFLIGTVYHGKGNNSYSNAGNDVKAIQTRSGNKMIMNDKDGSVHITDKGGADTMMDGAGNITTNANANSTLNAGSTSSINVGAKEGAPPQAFLTMDEGGNIVLDGKTSITIKVGGNVITIDKNGITTTAAEGDITTSADVGKLSLHSAGDMSTNTDANLTINAGPSAKISSSDTDII